jgi:hypothetical protein
VKFYLSGPGSMYEPIAKLALQVFTISASEAPCERMFSAAGYFDAARRAFAPQTLAKLTLCKFHGE